MYFLERHEKAVKRYTRFLSNTSRQEEGNEYRFFGRALRLLHLRQLHQAVGCYLHSWFADWHIPGRQLNFWKHQHTVNIQPMKVIVQEIEFHFAVKIVTPNAVTCYLVIIKTTTAVHRGWRCQQNIFIPTHISTARTQLPRTSQVEGKRRNRIPRSGSLAPHPIPRRLADVRIQKWLTRWSAFTRRCLKGARDLRFIAGINPECGSRHDSNRGWGITWWLLLALRVPQEADKNVSKFFFCSVYTLFDFLGSCFTRPIYRVFQEGQPGYFWTI